MARSNYADKPSDADSCGVLTEHRDRLSSNPRAYTPSDTENDYGGHSTLAETSSGDHFWKPRAYAGDPGWVWSREMIDATYPNGYVPNAQVIEPQERDAELEAQMPTSRGVPASPAELYRGQVFARA